MRTTAIASRIALAAALLFSFAPAWGAENPPATAEPPEPVTAPARPLPRVLQIRFIGNEHFSSRSLKRELETKANKPVDMKLLNADVDHIVARYADDGYLEARVSVPIEADKAEQDLIFTITEGPRYKLKELEIVGNALFSTEELRALVKPERDGYFSKGGFLAGAKRIWEHYGEVGRLTTVVEPQLAPPLGPDEAAARYVITEGPPVTLQSVKLEWANERITEEWLVWRELERKLHEGMALTLKPVEEAVGRLRKRRWFKSVDYRVEKGTAPDLAIVVIRLEEGGTWGVILSGTEGSYSGLSAALTLVKSNFDLTATPHSWQGVEDWNMLQGRGERLALTASPGQRTTTIGGSFVQPCTFGTNNNFVLDALYTREEWPDNNEWQWLVRPGLTRELSDQWTVGFGPMLEGTEIWDLSRHDIPDYNEAAGYTPGYGAWGRLSYSTTPDTLVVNRGVRASLMVEPTYEDTGFLRSVASARQFFPVHGEGFDAHVLELSAQGGQILGTAPFFDRFYCGGLGSVRGFDAWGISPLYHGEPIGGYYFASGSAEYSLPLFHLSDEAYFRGAVFVDAGDAETHLYDMGRIRVGAGFGPRILLPKANGLTAGLNFAWPINSYRGDSLLVFTFFMGMAL